MKKLFMAFSIVVITLLCSISVFAATDDSGMWEYQAYGSSVELMKYNGTQTDVYVPSKISKGDVDYSVLKLGDNLFKGNTTLNSATLGEGITEIGASAFEGATNLVCIVTPESLTTIGANAFSGCTNFNSVILYDAVINIGENSFKGCDKLTIYCNEGKTAHNYAIKNKINYSLLGLSTDTITYTYNKIQYDIIDGQATLISCPSYVTGDIVVPSHVEGFPVTSIYNSAFKGNTGITSVELPNSIFHIKSEAFSGCSSLAIINFPSSLLSIELYAFENCTKLREAILPEGITELGTGVFEDCSALKKASVPDNIESMSRTFLGCWSLTDVKLPKKLKNMSGVFYSCSSLTNVILPDTVETMETVFPYCRSLKSITLPANLKYLGDGVFRNCTSLKKVVIPEGTLTIGVEPFEYCSALTELYFPKSIEKFEGNLKDTYWGDDYTNPLVYVYDNTYAYDYIKTTSFTYVVLENEVAKKDVEVDGIVYTIEAGEAYVKSCSTEKSGSISILGEVEGVPVTKIGNAAFANHSAITSIIIPNTVKEIGREAFSGCNTLNSVTLSNQLVTVGDYAFQSCKKLSYISFPISVKSIGEGVFKSSGIKNFTIPYGITKVSDYMFENCQSTLSYVYIPSTVTEIGINAFHLCSGLKSIHLPDGVTTIGESAFEYAGLTSVNIPDSVTYVGRLAFSACKFTEISFPDGITEFHGYTLAFNYVLQNVKLPKNLKSMANCEFQSCKALSYIVFPESMKEINNYALSTWYGTLHVYKNSFMHSYAKVNSLPYVVIGSSVNPEISYGSGITGTATYTDGTAATGATVDILYDDGTVKESVTTDANGNYEFTYAEVGRYTIRVTDSKGNTASEIVSVKRMNVFDVYLAGETDLVLKKGYKVSGTVIPSTAKITISDTNGNIIKSIDTTNGTFTFTDIPRGSYIVKAENETGSATTEIYVSNEDVTGISIEIHERSATITGETKIENRDGTYAAKIWVNVDLIDADGNVVASTKTDANGKYTFKNIPVGNYKIAATTNEMRPDLIGGFDKSHELKGYGHIDVTEFIAYTVDTIVLREEKINSTSVSGKVTANGTTQDCQVILTNENGDQIAVFMTDNNGKYNFVNIPDGMYCITAITKVDGMGFAVITIENRVVHGDTDIKVVKADKISKREETLLAIPDCSTKQEALIYKEVVLTEKRFYDSLSEKERKQLSEEWIEKLFKLIDLISNSTMNATQGVVVKNEESIISPDEVDKTITFTLTVQETTAANAGEDGITSEEEYETEKIKDKKGKDREIVKYYDITFSKDGQNISNIQKQTETNGKLRITMDIPEEYRGHKHYSFIHMHKGEAVTLVDLDDAPNTVTFEIDKFSTFALAYSDIELIGEVEKETYPASISYNSETGKISVTSTEAGKLYIATYNGDTLATVAQYNVPVGTTSEICSINANQVAFVWNENLKPLCEKFTIGD